jgi:pimeloyl-ACP methyl ester carboxylesterase
MFLSPLGVLVGVIVGLLSLVILGVGLFWVIGWLLGAAIATTLLWVGIGFLFFSLLGKQIIMLLVSPRLSADEPKLARSDETMRVKRPDGTELHVEFFGQADAQPIVFTHGVATNSTGYYYAKRHLSERFRVILWDVAGLGKSGRSPGGDYSLEKMASDLEAVVQEAVPANKSVILAGHSMGGMITLTFCRLFPQHLGQKVSGLALLNTTYINPVNTAMARGFLRVVQKPLIQPLLYLIIVTSPLVWLQNWLSYLNGTGQLMGRFLAFTGQQSRGQLDFLTLNQCQSSPAVCARQMLAMFKYDARQTLPQINVPTLILAASDDRACIPEASHYMHDQIPNSKLVVLEPCGHGSIMERNTDFTQAVASFATSVQHQPQSNIA